MTEHLSVGMATSKKDGPNLRVQQQPRHIIADYARQENKRGDSSHLLTIQRLTLPLFMKPLFLGSERLSTHLPVCLFWA